MTDLPIALRAYVSPGPVAEAWVRSNDRCAFLMGPIGSGKTTAAIFKRARHALRMPRCNDGIIRCKWVIVRDSFRTLEKTTMASWRQWFPSDLPGSTWVGGNDRPATHIIRLDTKRGPVEMITEFAALGAHRIEDVLRGWEGSGAWMNEADLMEAGAKGYLLSRLRPFQGGLLTDQDKRDAMPRQLIGDLNAPDIENYVYKEFVDDPLPEHRLFRQPSGLSPAAENLRNLPKNYYQSLSDENKHRKWWVDRFVHNKFGYSREGKPVYECFDQDRHISAHDIEPDENLPLIIGLDAGLTPAAVLLQPRPTGQLVITDELVPGHGVGPHRFGEMLLDLLARRYAGVPKIIAFADPSSWFGGDKAGGELAWVETMMAVLGMPIQDPGTNEIGLRLEGVTRALMTTIDGTTPGLVVSRHCRQIIRGFAYLYRFGKRPGDDTRVADTPEKNDASHPHDALQYAVLGYRGRAGIIREKGRGDRKGNWRSGDPAPPKRFTSASRLF